MLTQSRGKGHLYQLFYPGINARVTAPFLIVVAIIAGIGVFIVTRLVAGSLQERFNNQLLDSARAASNAVVEVEQQQLATLRLMVYTEGVPQAVVKGDVSKLDSWLRPVAANSKADEVIIFDQRGSVLLYLKRDPESLAYETLPPPDISGWMGAQGVLDSSEDTLGDKFIDVIGTAPDTIFYISAPIKDGSQVVGGISLGMPMARLAVKVSEQSLSSVTLLNTGGQVLGTTLRTVPPSELAPTAPRHLAEQAEENSPVEERTLNGEPYQILYGPLKLRNQSIGLLAVGLPTNFIVERFSTSRNAFGVLFAALFLMVGGLGLLMARTITRPVRRLVDTTRAIRRGDLSQRVGLSTPDELGELAMSFDDMTGQLVARNEEIGQLYVQQIQETAQRDAILSSIGDAVLVQGPDGNMILCNEAANQLLKVTRQNKRAIQDLQALRRLPEQLAIPQTISLDQRYFSVLATPVQISGRGLIGHVIVFRDITALVESERLKDELILQMSHELRTPLAAARGYTDLVKGLESRNLSEQGRGFVQHALGSLSTLERMINQVIDVSAVISDRFTIHVERFNLADLLRHCAENWQSPATERQVSMSVSIPPGQLEIEGDQRALADVFDHLLRNAVNYTLPGGSIEVGAATNKGIASVYVVDTGVGIGDDEIPKVFERMYRGRSADVGPTDTRGLGLGLYLSKHIVEAHGGHIELTSKLDFGTVVKVDLPVRQNGGA